MSNKPTKEDLQFLDLSLSKEDAAIAEAARKNLMRAIHKQQAAGLCPRGGEIVDFSIGLCSCLECPTPRPGWVAK